jgi:CubicO group peptidase (beta-lactamase class C family)
MRRTVFKSVSSLFLIILLSRTSGTCQHKLIWTNEKLANWVDAYMYNAVKFDHFSGCILLSRSGDPFYIRSFGQANKELDVPNRPETKFLIGSVSKQFTAAAIMKLQEMGYLSTNHTIDKYLDKCPQHWKDITIKQLLNHTSGIVNFTTLEEVTGKFLMVEHTHEEVLQIFRERPLESNPGEIFNYNNSGYYLLGMIIEKVSGVSYNEYIMNNLFKPLGMNNTGFDAQGKLIINRASSYYQRDDMKFYNSPYTNMENLFSIGGAYSTVSDLLIWQKSFTTNRILNTISIQEMLTPGKGNYGYSWVVGKIGTINRYYHDGGISSFSTSLQWLPDQNLTVIVISNTGEDGGIRVAYDIVGKIGESPATVRGIQSDLMTLPADKVIDIINQAKQKFPRFDISENKVEEIGNFLLSTKKKKQALEVFKVNVSLYPLSANAHYRVGLAYEENKYIDLAIQSFKTCIGLDPKNSEAINHLNELTR